MCSWALLNGTSVHSWSEFHAVNTDSFPISQRVADPQKLVPESTSELVGQFDCHSRQCVHPFSGDTLCLWCYPTRQSGLSCLQPSLLTSPFLLPKLTLGHDFWASLSVHGSTSLDSVWLTGEHMLGWSIHSWPLSGPEGHSQPLTMVIFKGTEALSSEPSQNLCLLFWGAESVFSFTKF